MSRKCVCCCHRHHRLRSYDTNLYVQTKGNFSEILLFVQCKDLNLFKAIQGNHSKAVLVHIYLFLFILTWCIVNFVRFNEHRIIDMFVSFCHFCSDMVNSMRHFFVLWFERFGFFSAHQPTQCINICLKFNWKNETKHLQ